jgi:hypothetical protein
MYIIYNCMAGNHTSASTFGTLANEGTVNEWFNNGDSIVVNDSAHRQTKHTGALFDTDTSTTTATGVYHPVGTPTGSSSYAYFDFYKRHYMNYRITGTPSTYDNFESYVKFRIGWNSGAGWWIGMQDRNGSNTLPNASNFSTTGWVGQPGSSLEVGDGTWADTDTLDLWMGETHFAWATHHFIAGGPSASNISSGSNHFMCWSDFPYIDSIDGYHQSQSSNYYPGVMLNVGMSLHDVRVRDEAPGTSDQAEFQLLRYGKVNGIGGYWNSPASVTHDQYVSASIGGTNTYAAYGRVWPNPLSNITGTPTVDGNGPILVPVQYQGTPAYGHAGTTTTLTNAGGGTTSAQNFGDTRWGPMLNLYQLPDEFGNGPGDRLKVGSNYYRTAWTHKKGGSNSTFKFTTNRTTNVYGVPEKSVPGPDAL